MKNNKTIFDVPKYLESYFDVCCSHFGCGRKLSIDEKRVGNKCIHHSITKNNNHLQDLIMAGRTITADDIKKSKVAGINPHICQSAEKKPKRNKYNAVKVEFDGKIFDSQKECNRYIGLRALEKADVLTNLRCHVEYILESDDQKIASYIADFVYTVVKTGDVVVEDVKSPATRKLAVYRLKKKLMLAQYKIEIKEV